MANNTNDIRVMLETGPKGKNVIAVATGACWTFFDGVRSRVSAELKRGPRGGGRDQDHIVRHVLFNQTSRIIPAHGMFNPGFHGSRL